jgi:hypothetical protein
MSGVPSNYLPEAIEIFREVFNSMVILQESRRYGSDWTLTGSTETSCIRRKLKRRFELWQEMESTKDWTRCASSRFEEV